MSMNYGAAVGADEGIAVIHLNRPQAAVDAGPSVLLVHGALDQHRSFRRVARHLDDLDVGVSVYSYDRRGYGSSVQLPQAVDIFRHVDDLARAADRLRTEAGPPVVIGHSMGGLIALTATASFPTTFAAVGAYEPPYRWKPWWPVDEDPACAENPAATVELFYRRIMGDAAWDRASETLRSSLIAQGPALETDLRVGLDGPVFDPADVLVPVRLGHGSESPEKYRRSAVEMAADLAECDVSAIDGAGHGAHLSHADAFAGFIRAVIAASRISGT